MAGKVKLRQATGSSAHQKSDIVRQLRQADEIVHETRFGRRLRLARGDGIVGRVDSYDQQGVGPRSCEGLCGDNKPSLERSSIVGGFFAPQQKRQSKMLRDVV